MSSDVRTARHGAEDGFHEIQLSGKQLVFLFMATTIVSIVIFLCGVLVGRGVRGDAPDGDRVAQASAAELTPDLGPAAAPAKPAGSTDEPPTPEDEPAPSAERLDYPNRLSGARPPAETLAPPSGKDKAAPAPPPAAKPGKADTTKADATAAAKPTAAAPPATTAAPPPANSKPAAGATATVASAAPATPPPPTGTAPARGKYTVQVAAYAARGDAADLARKLTSRGYAAYVEAPSAGKGAKMYRVRVGSFADRGEADRMRQKLQNEGKFKPWVTTR